MEKYACVLLIALGLVLGGCNSDSAAAAREAAIKAAATQKVVADGSLMTPGTPQITPVPHNVSPDNAVVPLEWNMWWGENGQHWTVFVDGVKVHTGNLTLNSPQAQTGKMDVALTTAGEHRITVALCNDNGCTESKPLLVSVVQPVVNVVQPG